ncbi:MAG TPA: secretin N-terminal domain-containing protein, partial [Phycisphaerae bacterium]|nr:secretin N-terminal domain-containing protein [Phycisphaerae bacterium]
MAKPADPAAKTEAPVKPAVPSVKPVKAEVEPAPTTQPAAKAQTPPAETPAPEPANIRFQFKDESYRDLVRWIGRIAKKPILGDLNALQGQLTYFDTKPYTYSEAIDIVNQVLRTAGHNLMDAGRYMELVPVARMAQHPKLPLLLNGEDQAARRPAEEIVSTILPLQFIDADQAVSLVARMVHSFSTLSKLGSGKGILITDTVSNIRRIQRLLQAIDTGTLADQQLKYYRLKNAAAGDVANLVQKLFQESQQARRRYVYSPERRRYEPAPADPSEQVTVTSDARSNTVVVIASPSNHTMIEEIISKIDVDEPAAGAVRTFVLKNAKAADLAQTITAALGTKTVITGYTKGRPVTREMPAAKVVADDATNRLIVAADPDMMKRVEALVKELDEAATEAAALRIFPLKVANAASLVNIIQNTFATRDRRGRMSLDFSITAEPRTNSLIVRAPAAETEAIAKLITEFDKTTATEREFHVVRLEAGDAREMARALTNLLSQQPAQRGRPAESSIRIEADRGTNSLMISAAPGDWQQINSLLEKLTEEVPAATASTRIFKLKHAKSPEIARTLQQIFDPRRRRARSGQPEPVPVVVTHDAQSNTLVVSASGDDLEEVQNLLEGLDLPPEVAAQIQVRSYALTNADASELARSLSRLFAVQGGRRPGAEEPQPRFDAERNSNQLVVAATAEQFEAIEKLIQKMQTEAAQSEAVVKLFALKHAKADQLAPALTQVVQAEIAAAQRRGAARQRRSDFQISAEARTNSLLITAPSEVMTIIEQLIPKLDAADVAVQTTKVIELENADPAELAEAINAALAGEAPQPRRGRGPQVPLKGLAGRKVVVVPEQSARAVLLTGVTEDVEFAEQLIKSIDARPSTEKATVKTFKLKHAKAEELAQVLSATVGQARGGRGAVPTRISADKNANALVVSAAGDVIERIEQLLAQLDVEGAVEGAVTIEIVKLVNAKADEMAAALNAAQGTDPRQRGRGAGGEDVVRVTADVPANSLLLTGRPAQIDETKKLIVQLDKAAAELTSEMRIFRLNRAKAAEMVPVLERILLQQPDGRRRRGGGPPREDIRIAAQEKANAVIVQGPPEAVAMADEIIKQFDGEFGTETVIQIVQLSKAEATSLASAVNAILAEQARGRGGQPASADNAVVVPESNSNSLLVRGTKLQVQQAVELIKKLDEGGEGFATQVRVFALKHAEAGQASKTIEVLFRQIVEQQRRRGGRNAPPPPAFSIAPDDRTNSLIVSTSPANFTIVESLLQKLDEDAVAPLRDVQYIPLLHANASELVDRIEAMFGDRKKADQPVVEADDLSNGLTVIAKDADFRAIETMVAKWDEAAEANYIQVRVIPLSNQVQAEKLAQALKRLYEQVSDSQVKITDRLPSQSAGGSEDLFILPAPEAPKPNPKSSNPSAAPAKDNPSPTTQPAAPKAAAAGNPATQPAGKTSTAPARPPAPPPIIIAVDKESNSLIVSAARTELEAIESLIWDLTTTAAASEAEIKVYKVKVADPVSIAKTLDALFNPKPVAAPRPAQQRGRQPGQPQQATPSVPKPKILIAADARTRSVIVLAKPEELDRIEPLIKQLDQ